MGQGTFGQVRRAKHRLSNLKCAIKIIKKSIVERNATNKQLMKNELEVLSQVSHPNIVRVYDLLHDEKFFFVVTEQARYGDLKRYCDSR